MDNTLILDAAGMLHKAAYISSHTPVSSRHVLAASVAKLLKAVPPCRNLYAVFDGVDSGDERRALYPSYKLDRGGSSSYGTALTNLRTQAPAVVRDAGFTVCTSTEGYESDDCIAALSAEALRPPDSQVCIASDDKDMLALLADDRVTILSNGEERRANYVLAKFGVRAEQLADYLALCGDSSDNIPGVAGVGKKSAVALLRAYTNLNSVVHAYRNGAFRNGAYRTAFANCDVEEQIGMSRELVRLRLNATWEELN